MWYKNCEEDMHRWLTVKESTLPDAGYGLFVERKFEAAEVISVYLGKVFDPLKHYGSVYKLECLIPDTNQKMTLNVEGGGFPDNNLMYLGAHMINDPQLTVPEGQKDMDTFNVMVSADLLVTALKPIEIGDELFFNYGWKD